MIISKKSPFTISTLKKPKVKRLKNIDLLSELPLFEELNVITKGFKYQITLKVLLKKYKPNGKIEFRPAYVNSTTKIVINYKFSLGNVFQEILYMVDNWINKGSAWIVESINSQ